LTNVLPVDYLTPDAALCGAWTRPPRGGRRAPDPWHHRRWPAAVRFVGHRRPTSRVRRA